MIERVIFDAIPAPVFVVGRDTEIFDLNAVASQFCDQADNAVFRRRGGDVLHCLQSSKAAGGCGRARACSDCVIRKSVADCFRGKAVFRARMTLQMKQGDGTRDVQVLVTTSPIRNTDGEPRCLLMLEDVTSMSVSHNIVPTCSKCKKVRGDDGSWKSLEIFVSQNMGADFSHGICPECARDLYPETWVTENSDKHELFIGGHAFVVSYRPIGSQGRGYTWTLREQINRSNLREVKIGYSETVEAVVCDARKFAEAYLHTASHH